jgi:hypothetical protein
MSPVARTSAVRARDEGVVVLHGRPPTTGALGVDLGAEDVVAHVVDDAVDDLLACLRYLPGRAHGAKTQA